MEFGRVQIETSYGEFTKADQSSSAGFVVTQRQADVRIGSELLKAQLSAATVVSLG